MKFKKTENKSKCNLCDFYKGPCEVLLVHCICCNRDTKNKMSEHAMK